MKPISFISNTRTEFISVRPFTSMVLAYVESIPSTCALLYSRLSVMLCYLLETVPSSN